jgi:hypothetical protein
MRKEAKKDMEKSYASRITTRVKEVEATVCWDMNACSTYLQKLSTYL